MAHDWESVLGTGGGDLEAAFDAAVSDELYLDHPRASGTGVSPEDPGDDEVVLPFEELN